MPAAETSEAVTHELPPVDEFDKPNPEFACTMLELTNETCRWPYGHPTDDDFQFCGVRQADLIGGHPFCAFHARKAVDRGRRPMMTDDERQRRSAAARQRIARSGPTFPTTRQPQET